MMPLADTAKPRLAAKARLKWDAVREKHLLLYPEGVLVLNPNRARRPRALRWSTRGC
jgi:pyrroloquinoline quinone biosynthesis protein D